jgi:hypothetical protein
LEAIMGMEQSVQTAIDQGKKFAQDFKSGNVKDAEADADAFLDTLDQMGKKFDAQSMDAIMDIYQKLKHKGEK